MIRSFPRWSPISVIGATLLAVSTCSAQVTVFGGSTSVQGVGISGLGLGGLAPQSSFVGSDYLIATPGMTVGSITPWPLGIGAAPYAYPPAYYGGGPYYGGYYYPGPFTLPPLLLPSETIYGPGAMRRFMGIDPPLGTPIVNNTTVVNLPATGNGAGGGDADAGGFGVLGGGAQIPARPNLRASNAAARERARKLIDIGDGWFAKQRFAEASESYRQATRAAPDVADSYLRQMVVSSARGRYADAVSTLKAGLRLSTTALDGRFKIPALYGENKLAYTAHLDALAAEAARNPASDLWYLTGVMLYFGDEPRRAEPFFVKAAETAIGETWHIQVFREALKRVPAPGKPAKGIEI